MDNKVQSDKSEINWTWVEVNFCKILYVTPDEKIDHLFLKIWNKKRSFNRI